MAQTAVDWYVIEHRKLLIQLENKELSLGEYVVKHQDILKQAKLMEREQKIEFANKYADDVMAGCLLRAEQYYNITYGKE